VFIAYIFIYFVINNKDFIMLRLFKNNCTQFYAYCNAFASQKVM